MNLTDFGASGGIGGHDIALATQRGHHVRAVYRAAPGTPPPASPRSSSSGASLTRRSSPSPLKSIKEM
jgi:uncharacterized protein YbjT (DUF2867 family)